MENNFETPYGKCDEKCVNTTETCVHEIYRHGYNDSTTYWTNDCFFCGPAGEWSVTACTNCLSLEENKWFIDKKM